MFILLSRIGFHCMFSTSLFTATLPEGWSVFQHIVLITCHTTALDRRVDFLLRCPGLAEL